MTHRPLLLLAIFVIGLLPTGAAAETFVSLNGKFSIVYPDDWKQLDFLTVDAYLSQTGAGSQALAYEAAFAPESSQPWYNDAYLILTFDSMPGVTTQQADSILKDIENALGRSRRQIAAADLTTLLPGELAWDPATRMAAVIIEAAGTDPSDKASLLVIRFFEQGVANFYFYATDSAFAGILPVFGTISNSFSTDHPEAGMARETHKLADADKLHQSSGSSSILDSIWLPTVGAIVVLMAVAVIVSQRRKKSRANR